MSHDICHLLTWRVDKGNWPVLSAFPPEFNKKELGEHKLKHPQEILVQIE